MARRFHLISEWHLAASPDAVWAALSRVDTWPVWWPYVRHVHLLSKGQTNGEGDVWRLVWRSALPYGLTLDMTTRVAEAPQLMVGEASGDLIGMGRWEMFAIPVGSRVRHTWDVRPTRPWMRRLMPLLAPAFAWNHHQVMRAGAAGMADWLGVELIDYRKSAMVAGIAARTSRDRPI